MLDRRLIGDIALAALIAIPSASLARPDAIVRDRAAKLAEIAPAADPAHAIVAPDRHLGLAR